MGNSNGDSLVIVEQDFDLPAQTVWQAITDPKKMTQWFFENIPAFEASVGFRTTFPVSTGERVFTHNWEILEVIPPSKIKYKWSYTEYEGMGYLTFELMQKDRFTLLRLTHEGLDTFPQKIPEFQRKSCESGWKYFINQNLKNYLEHGL